MVSISTSQMAITAIAHENGDSKPGGVSILLDSRRIHLTGRGRTGNGDTRASSDTPAHYGPAAAD